MSLGGSFPSGTTRRGPIEIEVLGIKVNPLTAVETANLAAAERPGKVLLLNHNLHSAYLHEVDDVFRELYRSANWVVIDGTPIRWLASWSARRKVHPSCRIGSTDWITALSTVDVPRRLFVFGATALSNDRAVTNLRELLPSWTIGGVNGFVSRDVAVKHIREFDPDIVLVGLGMPRQEHFLHESWSELPSATYATVGGAIDYLAGTTHLAPRWLGRVGLEWAWRLAHQPRRLAHRYLVEPTYLARRIAFRRLRGGSRT